MIDDQWLKDQLAGVVPSPPPNADRLAGVAARRRSRQRTAAAASAAALAAVVVAATLTGRALVNDDTSPGPATSGPTEQTSSNQNSIPSLDCPSDIYATDDGPGRLATGAVAARLCGPGAGPGPDAPPDVLTTGIDSLVDSINGGDPAAPGCLGGFGTDYALVLAYPDASERRVAFDLACDYLYVGGERRAVGNAFHTFVRLLHQQRETTSPMAPPPEPKCVVDGVQTLLGAPDDMVAARMCVSFDEGRQSSAAVSPDDLATILEGWRTGDSTPSAKGPGCGPTTPSWILSGVTEWGDQVTIEAECDRPTRGSKWVTLPPQAREVVDRLIVQAGVDVSDGHDAETAWLLADAWLDAVNARALISYDKSASAVGEIANAMWVRDPWLPDGELDWDLLPASRIDVPAWKEAWRVPARTPTGQAVFTIVRDREDDTWRILSLDR